MNSNNVPKPRLVNFQEAMASLWTYFAEDQAHTGEITIPILGSGNSRIVANRVDLLKEIVESFLVATRNKKFCNKLVVVIYDKDIIDYNIDLEYVKDYLYFRCRHFESSPKGQETKGIALMD